MKNPYIVIFCLFLSLKSLAQNPYWEIECGMHECEDCQQDSDTSSMRNSSTCYVLPQSSRIYDEKFKPHAGQPIIPIRVNFIFMQRDDGSGGFQENDPEHQELFDQVVEGMNRTYAQLVRTDDPKCYKGTDFIPDVRIKFIVNRVYIRDTYGWNNDRSGQLCPDQPSWYLNNIDNRVVNNPNIPRGINIYFTENATVYRNLVELQNTRELGGNAMACSQQPSTDNYIQSSRVHMPGNYAAYWWFKYIKPEDDEEGRTWENTFKWYFIDGARRGIAHEIGHSLALRHEADPHHGRNECHVSIMSQSGYSPRNYLPPSEVGRIHAALSLTSLRTFVPDSVYIGIKEINGTDTWHNMRLYSSLKINRNATLTFPCEMTMPYQGNIEVLGKLVLNNSTIRSIKNDWKGITVKSGGVLEINATSINDYNVVVESGGTLLIKEQLTISGNHSITVKSGGRICIEPSAVIHLADKESCLNLMSGYLAGSPLSSSCSNSLFSYPISGNGSIKDYNRDVFIQNEEIRSQRTYSGRNIYVGNSVTTTVSQGDVVISNNAKVTFDAEKEVVLDKGFECKIGSEITVIKK
ncbi:MAG: hypothetical protein LIO93_09495 [Bacteroidales bacterium]|nr:hypothetical protein [Bacteroidales bacterium]